MAQTEEGHRCVILGVEVAKGKPHHVVQVYGEVDEHAWKLEVGGLFAMGNVVACTHGLHQALLGMRTSR